MEGSFDKPTQDSTGESNLHHDADDNVADDVSVQSGTSQGSASMSNQLQGLSAEKREEIAKNESKALFCMRLLLLFVLVASTVSVATSVYFYMSNVEAEAFRNQFESDAAKILEGVADSFDNTLSGCDELALSAVSHARFANLTWPFVLFPDFSVRGMKLIKKSNAYFMTLFPLIQADQRDKWQKFAFANNAWVAESIEIQANDEDFKGKVIRNYNVSYELYGFLGPVLEPKPLSDNTYLPSWQRAPTVPVPFPYNYDAWQDPILAEDVAYAVKNKQPIIARSFQNVIFNPDDPVEVAITTATVNWASNFIGPDESANKPTSAIGYPIIDRVDSVRIDMEDKSKLPLVGFLNFQVFWRDLIKDILPENSKGLILVVETECLSKYITYQIDGPIPTYLGVNDLHDPKYDNMRVSAALHDLMSTSNPNRDSFYTGLPLDNYCAKILHVYPSQYMEEQFLTKQPVGFTVTAVLIFAFTSMVFLGYDLIVSYRQKVVMKQAIASDAIVSSLFPQNVRKQLYDENNERQTTEDATAKFKYSGGESNKSKSSRPIADEFEETTVFFADISGFTAWSSKRTPTQVFELLEALYGTFDRIAKRRRVFKVETIGDCYVAVTGIPEAQPDHAVIMVQFARDCMAKMDAVVHNLIDSLGPDTADLKMRVGLHSGSTTAGVLRGDKGRFQLFGDTVNTASRMESNGLPDHIHISQATADALILKGKAHWLTPREEKITAKGKGLMQTYFVTTRPANVDQSVHTTEGSDETSNDGAEKKNNNNTRIGDGDAVPTPLEQPLDKSS